jgi:hypothetical protein
MVRPPNKLEIVGQLDALVLYGQTEKLSSQWDAVNWAGNVAALLKSADSEYHAPFLEYLRFISDPDLLPSLRKSNLNQMIKIAKQATFELQYDISRRTRIAEKMTLTVVLRHAHSDFWLWLVAVVLLFFIMGLFAGQIDLIRRLISG